MASEQLKPQRKAFEKWQCESPVVPVSWEDHEATFNAGFEAGVRYAFENAISALLGEKAT